MNLKIKIKKMTATQVRRSFGAAMEIARKCGAIQVTHRGRPAVYILSPAVFTYLRGIDDELATTQASASVKTA